MIAMKPKLKKTWGVKRLQGYFFPIDSLTPLGYPGETMSHRVKEVYDSIGGWDETNGVTSNGRSAYVEIGGEMYRIMHSKKSGLHRLRIAKAKRDRSNQDAHVTIGHESEIVAWLAMENLIISMREKAETGI